jgi:CheY-like chemotaxis protein/DNA-binding MarR family transcriptional regulator
MCEFMARGSGHFTPNRFQFGRKGTLICTHRISARAGYFASKVRLTLPRSQQKYQFQGVNRSPPDTDEMNTPGKGSPDRNNIDVLVVDDDTAAIEELVEYLSRAHLKCRAATDGWAALKMLADGVRPTVVVTDLRMPELTGMEFAERLKNIVAADRPEIIFVSGDARFDDAIAAIRLGARDMLVKPVEGPKLVQAVKAAQLARRIGGPPTAPGAAVPADRAQAAKADGTTPTSRNRAALNDLKTMRRVRSQYFPTELFSDPCWEMLLDLYDAHLGGAEVTVTSLGAASGVPQTTALRRMETLQGHGLITRSEDKDDKRRIIVRLTDAGLAAVERFFETYSTRRPA